VGKYPKLSERLACLILDVPRSTIRYQEVPQADETPLRYSVLAVANLYGRYGYRTVFDLLAAAGWQTTESVVRRIWTEEGLKVPKKQLPRGRLWLHDGSCVRLRPEAINHVWSYDFVQGHTYCPWRRRWRKFRILVIIDEYTRECLALHVARHIKAIDVIDVLSELILDRGTPKYIRSDNGPEFVATILRDWLKSIGTETAYIEPGSPWQNGYCESFNGKFRDQFLDGELFYSLNEARILIEQWRIHYNTVRPHRSIGRRPPAPATWLISEIANQALHQSLFPSIPTPQEVNQLLNIQ
jgi:putative transposase